MVAISLAIRWSSSLVNAWNNPTLLEVASFASTLTMVIGALIENWAKLKPLSRLLLRLALFRSTAFERCTLRKLALHSLGPILVVVGIGGEMIFETQAFIVEDRETATLSKEAGDAKQSATGAANALQHANDRLDAFEKTAKGLDKRLQATSEATASLEHQFPAAKAQIVDLGLRAGDAIERTKRLEAELSWRTVTPEQKKKLRTLLLSYTKLLMPLSDLKISIQYVNQDPEAEEYAHELKDALDGLGAELSEPDPREFFGAKTLQGLIVYGNPDRNPRATLLLNAIHNAGISVSGTRQNALGDRAISIIVGSKPRDSNAKQ